MLIKNFVMIFCLAVFAGGTLQAQEYKYIGASKCKMCHNKAATGMQYKIWSEGPHAKAMLSLSSEESLAYAKENGIADPTKEASCIKCHSTFGNTDSELHGGIKITEGVSCETCHGPGSGYKINSVMKDQAKAIAKGLIVPDEKMCVTCHNKENPFHKPFDYEKYKAKIAHPVPPAE